MKKKIFLLTCLLAVFTYQNVEAQEIRIFKKDSTVIRVTYAELDSIVSVDSYEEEEFVDLGLSVKWASRNLGAKSPEDYGDSYKQVFKMLSTYKKVRTEEHGDWKDVTLLKYVQDVIETLDV